MEQAVCIYLAIDYKDFFAASAFATRGGTVLAGAPAVLPLVASSIGARVTVSVDPAPSRT